MRKVIFGGANSLDNYFARKDGGMDWLMWSEEVTELMSDFWPKIDCIVMGRTQADCVSAMACRAAVDRGSPTVQILGNVGA